MDRDFPAVSELSLLRGAKDMRVIDLLKTLDSHCCFMSRERPGRVSNSELKRWCTNKSVRLNHQTVQWDEVVSFPVQSMVLFPKHPITLT